MAKENISSYERHLVIAFNTFFGDIVKNLKVQREESSHEIIYNNPDPRFNCIESHHN